MEGVKLVMKKTNYFSHDSNARNDSKIISLRMKLGVEGYGIYFMIIERLREESDYVSNKDYDSLAFDFRTTPEKVKSVIEDFGLFIFSDDDCFYSDSLMQRMILKDEKSKKHSLGGKKAMEKRWNNAHQNNKDAITNLSNSDNIVITNLHESDNKERKVKERKVNVIHTEEVSEEVEVIEETTDEFTLNLYKFKKDFPKKKRYEDIAIMFIKTKQDIDILLDEFIEENKQSRKHADKMNYQYLFDELQEYFFYC